MSDRSIDGGGGGEQLLAAESQWQKPTLNQLYAKLKREFTAADLQKYTVIEEGIPFEQVVAECDRIHREETAKLAKGGSTRR